MFRLFIFISIFPMFSCQHSTLSPNKKEEETDVFTLAIAEYLNTVYKIEKSVFDTLFIGQYEDHYNRKLPVIIQNTNIVLLRNIKEGADKLEYRKSFNFANIAELEITKDSAMYAFVTFFVEKSGKKVNWWPKHNCFINFEYDTRREEFKLDTVKFEYPYSNKYTKEP